MNPILKWLHKNDTLVHTVVMLVVFYGIPITSLSYVYPGLVEPLLNSALMGLTLVALLFVSYKVATYTTELIKSAITQATLAQMHDTSTHVGKLEKDAMIDYTSSNMLVIDSPAGDKRVAAPESALPVERKKRGPRGKSSKKKEG